jgi:hypothetical protein
MLSVYPGKNALKYMRILWIKKLNCNYHGLYGHRTAQQANALQQEQE